MCNSIFHRTLFESGTVVEEKEERERLPPCSCSSLFLFILFVTHLKRTIKQCDRSSDLCTIPVHQMIQLILFFPNTFTGLLLSSPYTPFLFYIFSILYLFSIFSILSISSIPVYVFYSSLTTTARNLRTIEISAGSDEWPMPYDHGQWGVGKEKSLCYSVECVWSVTG